MLKKVSILFIFIFVNLSTNYIILKAQNNITGQKLDLNECYKIAFENHPDIKVSNYRIKSSKASVKSAFGNYLPSVNFNMGYNRQITNVQAFVIGGRLITQPNTFSMNANAGITLFDGFSRENNITIAENNLSASELNNERTIETVKYNVFKAYLNVLQTVKIKEIRQQNLDIGKSDLERIKGLYEFGVLTVDNVYSQEAEVGNRELDYIRAENDFNNAKTNLITTIGLTPTDNFEIDDKVIKTKIELEEINNFNLSYGNFDLDSKLAIENRKDYQSTKINLESAEKNIDVAYSGYAPVLSANTGWSWLNSELNSFGDRGQATASLNLSIPIFDRFQNNANIENQKLQYEISQTELFKLEQNIKSAVFTNLQNLNAAVKQIKITEKSLESADLNYKIAKERYEVGAININDLTIANLQNINAQINKTNSIYNYISSKRDLLFSIGIEE